MACINVIAADTNAEAERLATSFYQLAMGIITGQRRPLPPPVDSMEYIWSEPVEAAVKQMMQYTFIGDSQRINTLLSDFQNQTKMDEVMVTSHIFDPEARMHSYEVLTSAVQAKSR